MQKETKSVPVVKAADEELKQVLFIAMLPDSTDLHGDYTSSEEVRKATEEIRKEREIRLDAEAVTKSKDTFKSVGIDHDVVAPAMRRLAEINPTLAKTVEEVLLAADAQVSESGLLKEFGTASTSTASVLEEAKTLAKSLVESGVVKTIEQGIERVLDTNPDLAKRYAQEGTN